MFTLPLVESLERAREFGVARIELLKLFEVADRSVGPVGEVFRGLRGVLEQRRALPACGGLQRPVVEREELVPSLGGVVEAPSA